MTATALTVPLKPGARVLVTAGASGIGRTIVDSFVAAGARVHVGDIDRVGLDRLVTALPSVGASAVDVGDPAQVDRLFDAVSDRLGGLDILINNAGIAGPTTPVWEVTVEDWRRTHAVNLDSHFFCAKRAVPLLIAAGGGSIVNLSSSAGRLGVPLRSPYCSTKWAVIGFTKALAAELGSADIRVNAILPGPVEGERIRQVITARAEALGITVEEMHRQYVGMTSLRRMTTAEDVANLVLFVCSEAGRNISGAALSVDGNTEYLR